MLGGHTSKLWTTISANQKQGMRSNYTTKGKSTSAHRPTQNCEKILCTINKYGNLNSQEGLEFPSKEYFRTAILRLFPGSTGGEFLDERLRKLKDYFDQISELATLEKQVGFIRMLEKAREVQA